jgi:YegS/Rv2252/BmrU family lipid kinase
MGIIPAGTCNDFAESLFLPSDEWDCINVVAENDIAALDVGRVNGKHIFLSSCAAGMFVNISYTTSSQLKKSLGPLAYYFSALGEIPHIRSFPLRIETDEDVIEDDFLLFLLVNGSQAAGLANLYPKARMRDGLMDLLLIRDVPPIDFPSLLIEIINRESDDEGRWLKRLRSRYFRFTSDQPILTTQDGEEGQPLPLEVEVLPSALNVYIRRT